jgi:CHASE2 domain-containing sensor protein
MTPSDPSSPHSARRARLSWMLLGLVYLAALSTLIVWEFRDRFDYLSPVCEAADAAPESILYSQPYEHLLDWASHDAPARVSVVAIPSALEELQNNICDARAYMADLLLATAAQHPAAIVIDRFYSAAACASNPASTRQLISVVQSLTFPVIVGESTNVLGSPIDQTCLSCKPQLDFASPNVHHGLTRLSPESERIPIIWRVILNAGSKKAVPLDSLSWATVKVYAPAYAAKPRLHALVESDRHPYANLSTELPRETSTDVLCATAPPETQQRWSVQCPGNGTPPSLLGKIVVIGAENMSDHRIVLGSGMWGFDQQARYIDNLLSGSYLYALPFLAAFSVFALFIFVIEGVPTLLVAFSPHWRKKRFFCHAYPRRRYFWVSFWTVAFVVVTRIISLLLRYLPPLAVLGDIAFVAVTRLLFFAAESSEHPFVHAKKKGTHHHV